MTWGLGFARWLLVLLLVLDQVGAPLHRHHHDSGIDGSWLGAMHDSDVESVRHVEAPDDGLSLSHAMTAVQPQPKYDALLTDASDSPALFSALAGLIDAVAAREPLPRPDPGPPHHTSFRSLPPAGRAPPLHA